MEEINKIASIGKINVEAEKLREKVSRETVKIIKLKVAQDTAIWDLKEKLQQVEGNHERLQQNMVEVQMQHEELSGKYQDELRLRPDTLNKLSSTREMCDVLEDYGNRLKETLSRCKADQGKLYAAYQESDQVMQDLAQRQQRGDEQKQLLIDSLQDKVRVANEHYAELLQLFSSTRQQAEAKVRELKDKLEAALGDKERLASNFMELKQKLDLCSFDIQNKQETIANLQKEKKELLQEFNTRSADANNTLMKRENDLKNATEANESLTLAINNKEEFIKTVCEQNSICQEKVAELKEEKAMATAIISDLQDKLQESANMSDLQKNEIEGLIKEKECLLKEISQQEELLLPYKEDINKLNKEIATIDEEKCVLTTNLNKTNEQLREKCKNIEECTANIDNLHKKLTDIENEHKVYRESSEEQIIDLNKTIEFRDKELDYKTGTITYLKSQLKMDTDVRSKLETTLQNVKKEIEIERTKYENEIQYKEEELSKQITIILDMKNEKERLQVKIQAMQNKIDKIQKEPTEHPKPGPAPVLLSELGDNAVTMTPRRETKNKESAVPRNDSKIEAVLCTDEDKTLDDAMSPKKGRRFFKNKRTDRKTKNNK